MWDEDSTDLPAILVVCHAEAIQSLIACLTNSSTGIPIVLVSEYLQKILATKDVDEILGESVDMDIANQE